MFRPEMSISEYVSCALVLYVQPLLCFVGILFNGICVTIFVQVQRHHNDYYRKTSLVNYLLAFTLCNMAQLFLSFPVIVFPALVQFMDEERFPNEYEWVVRVNSQWVWWAYPLLMVVNYAAIWLLTLICAQRYQAICHPSNVWKRRLQFVRRSSRCIAFCLLAASAFNAVRFWELKPVPAAAADTTHDNDGSGGDGHNEEEMRVAETSLRFSTLYKVVQEGLVYGCVVYGVPMAMLLWLNYRTYRIVTTDDGRRCRPLAEHRTALMTLTVFIVFALCTTMSASLRLMTIFCGPYLLHMIEYQWMVDLSNLLMNANALIMPVVCFVYTRGFRDLFFAIRQPAARDSTAMTYPLRCSLASNHTIDNKEKCYSGDLRIMLSDESK